MKNMFSQLFVIGLLISSGQRIGTQGSLTNNSLTDPLITQGTTTITIDGDPSDWVGITPFLVDPQGDSLSGPDTDIINVSFYVDDTYSYLMVRTASDIRKEVNNATIELNLDLRPGNSVCWHQDELHLNINYPDTTFYAWTRPSCDTITQFPIDPANVSIAWGSVLEVRILKSALGSINFFRPIFTAFWTNLDSTWTNVDLVFIPQVSGYIKDSMNNPIAGVTLSTGTGYSATTSSDGFYSIGLPIGNYTITPSMKCSSGRNNLRRCYFAPSSKIYTNVQTDINLQNYIIKKAY
jgi:hypothetical protein